jgi:hypothetical protein
LTCVRSCRKNSISRPTGREPRGSTLAEFAPALFILFFFALFPTIDLIGVGLSYCACMSLNDLQLREATRIPQSLATKPDGDVMLNIPNNWRPTVLGGAAGVMEMPLTLVTYTPGKGAIFVSVATTFTIHPMLTIPFFPGVPCLGAPLVTTITHTRMLENPSFAVR